MYRLRFHGGGSRNVLLLALVAHIAFAAGCGNTEPEDEASAAPAQTPGALVAVATTRDGVLIRERTLHAEARAVNEAALSPSAAGQVTEVNVREGSQVAEGDVLLRVNGTTAAAQLMQLSAQLEQAQVNLTQAQRDADRAEQLADRSIGSSQAAEQARSTESALRQQVEALRSNIAGAQQGVQDHVVRAPFSGTITARHVDPGDFINPGIVAIEMTDSAGVEVFTRVPAELLDQVSPGTELSIRSTSSSATIAGEVIGVVGSLDPATRTGLVRIEPSESPRWMRPGSTMEIVFSEQTAADGGVIVPTDALVFAPAATLIYKAVDDTAQLVTAYVVQTSNNEAIVRAEGLAPGEDVVVLGNERLRPGQPLNIVPREELTGADSAEGANAEETEGVSDTAEPEAPEAGE